MRVKRNCKEVEEYFESSGLRQPMRPSVNLPGALGNAIKMRPRQVHIGLMGCLDLEDSK